LQPPRSQSSTPGGIVFLIGYASTVSAVWGHDIVACSGVGAGVLSALLRLSFLVFVSPSALAVALLLLLACTALALAVGALPVFRDRKELLLLLLPVAWLLIGLSVGSLGLIDARCSLSPWR